MRGLFRDTVTLYHAESGGVWRRTVLEGVLLRQKRERTGQRTAHWQRSEASLDVAGGAALTTVTTLRVPARLALGLAVSPAGQDLLVPGLCPVEPGPGFSPAALRQAAEGVCTVRAVTDATGRRGCPHLLIAAV